jgi:hypothetical protein
MQVPTDQLFTTIVDLRNTELSTMWSRFNIHLLVNGGFLMAFVAGDDDKAFVRSLGHAPYIFGLALGILWLLSEIAGRQTLHRRDAKIAEFETKFWEGKLGEYQLFRDTPCWFLAQSWVSKMLIFLFLVVWVFLWSCYFMKT